MSRAHGADMLNQGVSKGHGIAGVLQGVALDGFCGVQYEASGSGQIEASELRGLIGVWNC